MNYIINHSTLKTSLVSYWEMQELSGTRYDAHGANNLTANGTGGIGQLAGKVGWGADLETSDTDYLSITDASQSGLGFLSDFSWSLWLNPESQPTSTNQMGVLGKWATNDGAYSLTIWNDAGTYKVRTNIYDSGSPGTNVAVSWTVNLGTATWKHIVWTVDVGGTDSVGELWVNGVSQGTGTYTAVNDINPSSGILGVGGGYEGLVWQNAFDGVLDQVGAWSKVLTSGEITDLYNSGSGMGYGIAVDFSTESFANASTLTKAVTITGDDNYLIANWYAFNTTATLSSITCNGVAMTLLATRAADGTGGEVYSYGLKNPTTGNIVITYSGAKQIFLTATNYNGVNQTTPAPDAVLTGAPATNTVFSISTTNVSVANSWVNMCGRSPSRTPTASAGSFTRQLNGTSGDAGWTVDSNKFRATGANTLDFTWAPTQVLYYVISNLAPVAGTAAVTPRASQFLLLSVG